MAHINPSPVQSGTYVGSSVTVAGHTETLSNPATQNTPSGALSLHINRDAATIPVGISFDTAGAPVWETGLDSSTSDLVLAYDPAIPGDQIRVRKGMFMEIGVSVAQPANDKRLRITSTNADAVSLTQLLVLDVGTGSPVTTPLNITNAGVSKFSVDLNGVTSIQGVTTVNNVFKASQVLVGNPTSTAGLATSGSSVASGLTSVDLFNTAGKTYRISSGLAGVNEAGFSIRDVTAAALRFVITTAGSTVLGTSGAALANAATDGYTGLPTVAGIPTGVPTAFAGAAFTVYDTTNHKLWVYDAGWKGVVLA